MNYILAYEQQNNHNKRLPPSPYDQGNVGNPVMKRRSKQIRKEVIAALAESGEPMAAHHVADVTTLDYLAAYKKIQDLHKEGVVERTGKAKLFHGSPPSDLWGLVK